MLAGTRAGLSFLQGQTVDSFALVPAFFYNEPQLFIVVAGLEHEDMIRGDGLDGLTVDRVRSFHGYSIVYGGPKSKALPKKTCRPKSLLHKGLRWPRPAATAVSPYLTGTYDGCLSLDIKNAPFPDGATRFL